MGNSEQVNLAKACWAGGTAQIYVNTSLPAGTTYEQVRTAVINAFQNLTDPANPGAQVVLKIMKKEELRSVDGSDSLHPNRSGDVVVVLNPPYQFDAATFGQHGFLPETVNLADSVNMHATFVAAGLGIRKQGPVAGVRAIDLAPTISFLLNIPGPINACGLRADLTCPTTDNPSDFCPAYTPPPYPITRGQVLTVLPFGNLVATVSINRAELKAFLENGVSRMPAVDGRFPQVSGLCFTYDISAAVGSRVTGAMRQAADGSCTGTAIDLTSGSTYTLATNDFVAYGGDGYPNAASRMTTQNIMDQVLADYITTNTPVSPAIQGRIVCTTNGATACPVVTP